MRARVPDEMKEMVLKQLRHLRFWSNVKWSPVALVIFSVVFALALFAKGHAFLFLLEHDTSLSKGQIMLWGFVLVSVFTCMLLIYVMRKEYRKLMLEMHLYCRACDAVDNEDEGRCHNCGVELNEQSAFICVFSKEEVAYLNRLGLTACKEFDWAKTLPVKGEADSSK